MYIIMNVMSINLQLVEALYAEEIRVGHALLLAKLQLAHQEQALAN
jgi:hypothetical protein